MPLETTTSGSHASKKDWALPEDLVTELSGIHSESVESILDRYNLPIKPAAAAVVQDASVRAVPKAESAFMTALLDEPDARTANNAPAYSSSNDVLVDLFWKLVPTASALEMIPLLEAAWEKDSLSTLKIIWQARSIHDGKGIKDSIFYELIGFLYRDHPRTLLANLHLFVDKECTRSDLAVKLEKNVDELVERENVSHGYYKDLLNILVLAVSGGFITDDIAASPGLTTLKLGQCSKAFVHLTSVEKKQKLAKPKRKELYGAKRWRAAKFSKDSVAYFVFPNTDKGDKHSAFSSRLHEKLASDFKFRAMYIIVCKLFAESMKNDLQVLGQLEKATSETRYAISSKMTLAAKWAPTPAKAHDKQLFMATAISCVLFPEVKGTIEKRMAYQSKVLTPLRKALDITEVKMAAGQWCEINYGRCPSKSMMRNKVHFFLRDEERFGQYIEQVMQGTKKISGATLFPHELVIEAMDAENALPKPKAIPYDKVARWRELNGSVIDSQWKSLVQSLKDASGTGGGLANAIAVADVSGSMYWPWGEENASNPLPIHVSLALGLITAQLAEPPYNNAFITFSAEPAIIKLGENKSLTELVQSMQTTNFGLNTDFMKVFQLILDVATKNGLKKEEMVKRVFVFSDMQFDEAVREPQAGVTWNETVHQTVRRLFNEAGYDLPEIVYWNIKGGGGITGTLPARADQPGVQLLSGYSASLMKTFLGKANDNNQAEEACNETAGSELEDDDEMVNIPASSRNSEKKEQNVKPSSADEGGAEEITPAVKLAQILANPSFSKLRVFD